MLAPCGKIRAIKNKGNYIVANKRDTNKRLKGFGIPIEVCIRYERMAGVKTDETPTKEQQKEVSRLMINAMTLYASEVVLTSKDYEQIAREVANNEQKR